MEAPLAYFDFVISCLLSLFTKLLIDLCGWIWNVTSYIQEHYGGIEGICTNDNLNNKYCVITSVFNLMW